MRDAPVFQRRTQGILLPAVVAYDSSICRIPKLSVQINCELVGLANEQIHKICIVPAPREPSRTVVLSGTADSPVNVGRP